MRQTISEILAFLIQGTRMLFLLELKRLPADIQHSIDERHDFVIRVLSVALIAFGFLYHTVIAQVEYHLPILYDFRDFIASSNLLRLFYLTLIAIFFKKMRLGMIRILLAIAFVVGFAHYTYLASVIIAVGEFKLLTAFGFAGIYAMGIGMIAMIPFEGLIANALFSCVIWLQTMWLVSLTPDPLFGTLITCLAYGITYALKGLIWTLICHYVVLDIKQKEKIIRTERALIGRDLELARQIQDSMSPPKELRWGDTEVTCYTQKHDAVGGDWAAIHCDSSNALNLVVADAMGKGLQAALVIHAVQSLWAEAVSEGKVFNPEQWLRSLNSSLFYMGQNATHFVTMGLLRITDEHCTYWSAAHVPLFVISEERKPRIRSILAAGSPLGVNKNPIISSRTFSLTGISTLLLGTDGVFVKGSRHTYRELLTLNERLLTNQENFLNDISVQDDKTLIVVKKIVQKPITLKRAS